ncbi:MAG: peptidoglycan DD-metalloendopeptidase family protein [Chloroflexota bacterium]
MAQFTLTVAPMYNSVTRPRLRPQASVDNGFTEVDLTAGPAPANLPVLDVQADLNNTESVNGKLFYWLQADFPGIGKMWIRDDLCTVVGDGSAYGYGNILAAMHPHLIKKGAPVVKSKADSGASGGVAGGTTAGVAGGSSSQSGAEGGVAGGSASDVSVDVDVDDDEVKVEVTVDTTSAGGAGGIDAGGAQVGIEASQDLGPAKAQARVAYSVRTGPGQNNGSIGRLVFGNTYDVIGSDFGDDGIPLHWVKIRYNGQEAFVREDAVRLSGNYTPFGLNAPDKYPHPHPDSRWSRGWDMIAGNYIWSYPPHDGWDTASDRGAPIYAGPQGGVVWKKLFCQNCGPQARSVSEVLGTNSTPRSVFSDDLWGDGYGHYLILGYENSKLPASTQQWLKNNEFGGQHIFVMYAHLHEMFVNAGQEVPANHKIGTCGNSGNSFGAHLHLELRISPTMSPRSWWDLKVGRRSPGVLFAR